MATTIRPVEQQDNEELAKVLREVLVGMGVPKVGTAYADKALDEMFETYNFPKDEYFIVIENGEILYGWFWIEVEKFPRKRKCLMTQSERWFWPKTPGTFQTARKR